MNANSNNITIPWMHQVLPNLISQDLISVQPLKGPVGIPFAMNFAGIKHMPVDVMQHILTMGYMLYTHTGDVSAARVIVERMGSNGQLVYFNVVNDIIDHDAF